MTPPVLQPLPEGRYGPWHVYWLCWAILAFVTFIAPEVYALVTDWRRTLSAAVWNIEHFVPGQPISKWSAFHFLFIGVLLVLFVWLLMHFAMGWWRG